jgi:hypothetical protein
MRLARLFAFAFGLICFITCATAQHFDWSMKGARQMNASIRTLPSQDQRGIERALHEHPENLHAVRINTPAGHLFLVQGFGNILCSPTSNCESWALDSDYKILFSTIAQMLKVQSTAHHGKPDVLTYMHGGASTGDLKQWRFDGTRYHRIACESYDGRDSDGNELKQPLITPCASR